MRFLYREEQRALNRGNPFNNNTGNNGNQQPSLPIRQIPAPLLNMERQSSIPLNMITINLNRQNRPSSLMMNPGLAPMNVIENPFIMRAPPHQAPNPLQIRIGQNNNNA